MDDLTITKLCAEAMGWTTVYNALADCENPPVRLSWVAGTPSEMITMDHYDPLHDDAQCFALEELIAANGHVLQFSKNWHTCYPSSDGANVEWQTPNTGRESKRRFVCECVAKMTAPPRWPTSR